MVETFSYYYWIKEFIELQKNLTYQNYQIISLVINCKS